MMAVLYYAEQMPTVLMDNKASSANGESYSAERLAELRSEGKPVFVDMTAAWCLTCLVNERLALSTDAVRDSFSRHHIVYLKGDWTQQDAEITKFIQEHGSEGVPLYVYYPEGAGAPVVLPQILTASIIIDAINHNGS
jgi:thiol:disulfide interchange protein DsbD